METFYKDFGITPIKDKKNLKQQELYNLFKKPIKDYDPPKYTNSYSKNYNHQADLLFLPDDNGFKYALVVTDIATRISDAEPLKSKNSDDVKKAFKKIYDREILKLPYRIDLDSGTEFKSSVKKYFEDNGVFIKYGVTGRHRQLAMVERTNMYLGKALFMRMYASELLTGQTEKGWVTDLPVMISSLNKVRERKISEPPTDSHCQGKSCDVLEIGTRVRVQLDNPKEYVGGEKLHGTFRATDMRYDPEIRTVGTYMFLPGQPPLYFLNSVKDPKKFDMKVAYTKAQLQIVPQNEKPPPPSVLRGEHDTYVAESIISKKRENGKIFYKVKWKAFNEATWEPAKVIEKQLPKLVKEFHDSEYN